MSRIDRSPGRTKFGEDASLYDASRPGYPPGLYEWLQAECALVPTTAAFEIGAGTGQATAPVLALGIASLLAIEPDDALSAILAGKFDDPRLHIAHARFEDIDLGEKRFDFGFSAMSFHWLQRMKAFARILAALKPGGSFAMWWNIYHDPARPDAFDLKTSHLFEGLEQDPDATRKRPAFGLDAASRMGEMRAAGFVNVRHRLFSQTVDFTPEALAGLYGTFSRVRMAPPETRERLLGEVVRIAGEQFGGRISRTIACSAFLGSRTS